VPQDLSVFRRLAQVYLADEKRDEARAALAPMAFDPHEPADNEAAKLIAMIDAGKDIRAVAAEAAKQGDSATEEPPSDPKAPAPD
jgi:hypothetical protein